MPIRSMKRQNEKKCFECGGAHPDVCGPMRMTRTIKTGVLLLHILLESNRNYGVLQILRFYLERSLLRCWLECVACRSCLTRAYFICFRVIYTSKPNLMAVFTIFWAHFIHETQQLHTSTRTRTANRSMAILSGNTGLYARPIRPIVKSMLFVSLTLHLLLVSRRTAASHHLVCFYAGT